MEKFAYIRIKTNDTGEDKHLTALKEHGLLEDHIYTDISGRKDSKAQNLQLVKGRLQKGDLLYISSLDDLGSNYQVIFESWKEITTSIGADIAVMDMPLIDTRIGKDLMGDYTRDVVSQFLDYLSENKYKKVKKRQRECIDAALAKGVRFGRREKEVPENFLENVQKWNAGLITLNEAAKATSMPVSTFYRKAHFSQFLHYEIAFCNNEIHQVA